MFLTAAVSARAALLPWAAPLLPAWAPACAGPPDPASVSGGRLLLNPDPAHPLQAQDNVVLHGTR